MRPAVYGRFRRSLNLLTVAAQSVSSGQVDLPDRFFVKGGYQSRETPAYDDAFATPGTVWQPRVYVAAAAVARALGSKKIVDVGAGNGEKLAGLGASFELVGIDMGPNLDRARERYPHIRWVERDLDDGHGLGLEPGLLDGAVIVCADVIEHLRRPEAILKSLRSALEDDGARCVVLSTPDRELNWGARHGGPPPNPGHVREWARRELAALLAATGFDHGRLVLTQSRTGSPLRNTILAVLAQDDETLDRAFAAAGSANRNREVRP
jgi:2-polyprenyl-3-methyl-5-hydroxy-6-metoxy-1,4-benzoquinol methylase